LKGKSLLDSQGACNSCHIVNGNGESLGPDLSDVGARRSAAYLRKVLIHPGAAVPEGFMMVRVVTKGEGSIEGIRLNEDTFTIQIRDLSNRFHSVRKSDVAELTKEFGKSPMPSYQKSFAPQEMDDLIAYLASLGSQR
jgi:putative heme-binding domain-containing protein